MGPPTFTKIAKLVRCVLLHWTMVLFPFVSVLCNPSNDQAPFPTLWVKVLTVRITMHRSCWWTATEFCTQQLFIHLHICKVPENTARIRVSSLKILYRSKVLNNICTYLYQVLPLFQSSLSTLVDSALQIYMLISNSYYLLGQYIDILIYCQSTFSVLLLNWYVLIEYQYVDISQYQRHSIITECILKLLIVYLALVQFHFHSSVINCLEWKCTVVWACLMYAIALVWYQFHPLPNMTHRQYGVHNSRYSRL